MNFWNKKTFCNKKVWKKKRGYRGGRKEPFLKRFFLPPLHHFYLFKTSTALHRGPVGSIFLRLEIAMEMGT